MPARLFFALPLLLAACALSAGGAPAPVVPVNFKISTLVDSSHEGPDRTRSYITAGAKRISFYQPPGSEISGAADSLTVYLAKRGLNGQFTVTNSSFKTDIDFIAGTQGFYDAGKATIPGGAEEIAFKGADYEGYAVSQHTGVGLDWTYSLFGKTTHRQVAYVNIDADHQVCLTVIADEQSWGETIALARTFLNGWFWVDEVKGQMGSR